MAERTNHDLIRRLMRLVSKASSGSVGPPGPAGQSPVVTFGTAADADRLAIDGLVQGPHLTGPQGTGGGAAWGAITGALAAQADLAQVLAVKSDDDHLHAGEYDPIGAGLTAVDDHENANNHALLHANSLDHARQHAIGSSQDHTFPGGSTFLRADGVFASPPGGSDPIYTVLPNGTTAMAFGTNDVVKVTPTANATYTTTVPAAGKSKTLIILTSGTTSRTITFGTGFKSTGTLATGTTSGRVFVIHFISDGVNLYEAGRTTAMAA